MRRRQQIVAAHHLRNPHRGIVHHHGQHVTRALPVARDHEVSAGLIHALTLRAGDTIVKARLRAFRHAKPPGRQASRRQFRLRGEIRLRRQ